MQFPYVIYVAPTLAMESYIPEISIVTGYNVFVEDMKKEADDLDFQTCTDTWRILLTEEERQDYQRRADEINQARYRSLWRMS